MEIVKSICILLCGVGIFLTGMKLMGDGLKRGSNAGLRALFAKTGTKNLACYGIGAATTALVQSSAATTVMSIGLVNAGIMTLAQASALSLSPPSLWPLPLWACAWCFLSKTIAWSLRAISSAAWAFCLAVWR